MGCTTNRHGFSLVELSIVLVILGLLVGGILAGQSLIRASELRSVGTEFDRYKTSVYAFRDKYMGIPGDIINASGFWGAADGTTGLTAACATTQGTGTTTCNGNADGRIAASAASNEIFRFWQQLANAGLVAGQYTGVEGLSGNVHHTSANAPASKISGAFWGVTYMNGDGGGGGTRYNMPYNNMFRFGKMPSGNHAPLYNALRPEEAWNIDTKLDDGQPARGSIIVTNWSTCSDSDDNLDFDAAYRLTNRDVDCGLHFRNAF